MNQLFSQDILDKSIFKWQDLAGKELLIRVGTTPDELGKGMDKSNGKCYVLHIGIEEYK